MEYIDFSLENFYSDVWPQAFSSCSVFYALFSPQASYNASVGYWHQRQTYNNAYKSNTCIKIFFS